MEQQPILIAHSNGVPLEQGVQDTVEQAPEFASWVELSTPAVKTVFVPALGKSIQYLSFVPFDKLVELQTRFQIGTPKRDMLGFATAILRYVMVQPACRSDAEARAAMKSAGPLVLSIIGETVTPKDLEEANQELAKNSQGSASTADS